MASDGVADFLGSPPEEFFPGVRDEREGMAEKLQDRPAISLSIGQGEGASHVLRLFDPQEVTDRGAASRLQLGVRRDNVV
eukprot:15265024-Heterocapsa_arctica.AAC.1